MAKGNLVCVDSSVFISYLKGGTDRLPIDVPLLKGFFNEVDSGKIQILFPTMERGEMLECKWPRDKYDEFIRLLDLPNVEEATVTPAVSETASEIRSYYSELNARDQSVPRMALPDSIIVATAIVWECAALYTYDGEREPPAKPKKLLGLKNPIGGKYPLHIMKPDPSQLGF
jgi:hypothetical protein